MRANCAGGNACRCAQALRIVRWGRSRRYWPARHARRAARGAGSRCKWGKLPPPCGRHPRAGTLHGSLQRFRWHSPSQEGAATGAAGAARAAPRADPKWARPAPHLVSRLPRHGVTDQRRKLVHAAARGAVWAGHRAAVPGSTRGKLACVADGRRRSRVEAPQRRAAAPRPANGHCRPLTTRQSGQRSAASRPRRALGGASARAATHGPVTTLQCLWQPGAGALLFRRCTGRLPPLRCGPA